MRRPSVSLPPRPTTVSARCMCCAITLVSEASLIRGSVRSQRGSGFWASTCGAFVHGIRAFLPRMLAQTEGHIVNTASMAGLHPGASPIYDASKHAVVALSEDLYRALHQMQAPIGVSVLCPGFVRTNILDAERNWPVSLGTPPDHAVVADIVLRHAQRAVDEGTNPAVVADLVANAVMAGQFWVLPHPEFVDFAVRRWHSIAEGLNPELNIDIPGMPPAAQIADEIRRALEN
jgi:NAD(P)-dependent dehydrogenase (short-subunit alcohol dehydrogenase family)